MHKKIMILVFLTVCFFLPNSALAKPQIEIQTVIEKEVIEKIGGQEVKRLVPADEVEPGQMLIFTLKYANKGDEQATNVVIKNPIPKDTIYIVGSATGDNPMFSIDGSRTFKRPNLLTYKIDAPNGKPVQKVASSDQYTDIRWIIAEIPAGAQGVVSFQAKVR